MKYPCGKAFISLIGRKADRFKNLSLHQKQWWVWLRGTHPTEASLAPSKGLSHSQAANNGIHAAHPTGGSTRLFQLKPMVARRDGQVEAPDTHDGITRCHRRGDATTLGEWVEVRDDLDYHNQAERWAWLCYTHPTMAAMAIFGLP